MRVGEIVLRLRNNQNKIGYTSSNGTFYPYFGDMIAGAAELDLAVRETLRGDMAFVVPLFADAGRNDLDNSINQKMYERFAVVVALANDKSQREKTGVVAFDQTHDIRECLINVLVGWQPSGSEGLVFYRGERNIMVTNAYLFYQFEFEYANRIVQNVLTSEDPQTGEVTQVVITHTTTNTFDYDEQAYDWEAIYANFILSPSTRLPYKGKLPLDDGYPNVSLPDNMAQHINMNNYPENGAFWRSFGSGFDRYTGD